MKTILILLTFVTSLVLENYENVELIEPRQLIRYWGYTLLVTSILIVCLELKKEMDQEQIKKINKGRCKKMLIQLDDIYCLKSSANL